MTTYRKPHFSYYQFSLGEAALNKPSLDRYRLESATHSTIQRYISMLSQKPTIGNPESLFTSGQVVDGAYESATGNGNGYNNNSRLETDETKSDNNRKSYQGESAAGWHLDRSSDEKRCDEDKPALKDNDGRVSYDKIRNYTT